ncbi:MAG: cytochrome c3 family protein [Nitrospirota bacterium]|nr:cytochrome c3 family protein [Nitrospirota bacterium]
MKRLIIIPCFFLILAITAIALANPEKFSIIRPADYSVVEGELIPIVIKFSRDVDAITIAKDNDEVVKAADVKGMKYLCKTVKLNFGPNEIVVSALEGGRVVESKKAAVFYRADLSMEFMNSPPEFQKKPFHKEDNEWACLLCHDMKTSGKDLKPLKPGDSVCYPCHKGITEYSYVHGPAARWVCLSCHEQNSKPVKYITQQPDRDLCFGCHKDKKKEWTPKKYRHGPIVAGKCSICHNPHASDNISRLKKPTWDLCIECHEGFASGKHVVAGLAFGGSGHPTKGRPDPLRPGKELSCASCHNPHAGNSREHFVRSVISRGSLCKMCHKNRK